ncbi:sugar transferase [Candidatus Parcubacteria bacterium]|nr:sugar transferase [Candidatus Parcubacteria bacterium]
MNDIYQKIKYLILFIGDLGILYLSLWLTLLIRYQESVSPQRWEQHFLPFSLIFAVWLVVFYISGIYSLQMAKNNVTFYSTLFKTLAWCAGIAMAYFYILKPGIAPKTNLLLELVILIILFVAWRQIFNSLVKIKPWQNNVLIIGLSDFTLDLSQEINSKPQLGFKVVGIVDAEQKNLDKANNYGIEIINPPYSFAGLVKIKKIKSIITALNPHQNPELVNKLYECIPLKISFWDLSSFVEKFTGKIPINTIGQVWFLENVQESQKIIFEFIKRVIDIIASIILLIVTLPFLPFIYAVVKLNSPGDFLFIQQRTGRRGKKFMAVKIRTMSQNAEKNGPQWAEKNDNRVTRSGRLFRKTRIDEIPQLINVLRGEMSFIGPRPERPEFIEKLEKKIPYYNERLLVKPGLTGWAQINFPYGASEKDALEKLQYDLYYIKNRSFILDLSIILKTIKTVLSGAGQ